MIAMERKEDKVVDIFLKTIRRYDMIRKGESVMVALSGGPDSVSLFDLFYRIRADWKLNIHLVHVNHSLRGEASDRDQMFAERFARELKMPISIKKIDVEKFSKDHRMSLEEAGRECRLQFFKEEGARLGISKVALGHHRDDQAETVLFRLIRGTGLRGIGGMKPVSEWQNLTLIRPLIEFGKEMLQDYVRDRKLTYCVDGSNTHTHFVRNRIRHQLIPYLERHYNPRIKTALAHLADTVALDLAFIEELALKHYPKIVRKRKGSLITLKKKKFLLEPEALRFRILQKAIRELDPDSELTYFHWDEIRKALERNAEKFEIHIPSETSVSFERKEIILKKPVADKTEQYRYELPLGGKIRIKEKGLEFAAEAFEQRIYKEDRQDKTCGIFDLDKISFPIVIRNRREGDMFQPLGMPFPKKLKEFLISRKVASYDKNVMPLFLSGNEIFWVYGVEISERFKVSHKTRRFLKISNIA
ncbi:MAG TPA: tRNA lysidine(34) synthetase TilS [Candidatus Omnitrophota bacterium]|nr:tRNA lysidine(34) synthetase TilS [Candidatus Omnitrophota bacterium]